jgi:ArsR family transcriptional regulator
VNLGFAERELQRFATRAGLEVQGSGLVTRERRPPHFEVISVIARRPADAPRTHKAKQ